MRELNNEHMGELFMPFCKVGQMNIYYEDIGEGIPVLMIHGFTPDHRLMKGCMEPVLRIILDGDVFI
jgi:pimeloyl-ACP methyl ester carboxylesterase